MFDMIPQGWKIVELSEIADGDYGIVDGPFGSNLKVSDYIDDSVNGVPVLATKNLNGDYSKDSVRYISKEKFDSLKRSAVTPGDIIVAKIGSIGKCGIYPLDQRIALIPANLLKITPKSDVNRKYVFYYIQSAEFQKRIKSIATATAQPAFNVTKFRKLPIPIPSLPEQNRIVARIEELFSELDNGVETLRKTKQQLAVYRQSAMNTVFQSVLQDAVTMPMGEVLSSIEGGKSFKCEEHPPHATEYGIVKVSAVTWGTYNEEESKTCLPNQFIESKRIKIGDFLFSRANTLELIGNCVVVENVSKNLMLSDKILRFHFKDGVIPKYVMYYLRTHEGKKQIQEFSTGNQESMRNIGQDRIKRITVPMCSTVIQDGVVHEIEARLSVCDSIEKTVDTALQQAEAMRQSVLKQAFEGRLRYES